MIKKINWFICILCGEQGVDDNKDLETEKLYLNCDRENIAILTGAIVENIKNIVGEKLQLKCVSEQIIPGFGDLEEKEPIENYERNEKIVIYAENHAIAERIADEINQLRNKKPQLFSTTKVNPLLPKKYGFIGIAKEKHEYAVTPAGHASGKTYNDYMADLMYKCILSGCDRHFEVDYNTCDKKESERMKRYVEAFKNMEEGQKKTIVNVCKEIFYNTCKEYNVDTVYTPVINSENHLSKGDTQKGA